MSLSDFVVADVSISNTSGPTVAGLNVGLLCAYHTKYVDRVRVYSTSSVLTAMVADGFKVTDPAYLMAEAYAAAPKAPALVAIGRRALAPQQSLQLTCVDGTVNDAYHFLVVSSSGVSTSIDYENIATLGVALAGTALSGTATVTPGSPDVTFSASQTLAQGEIISFSTQAGVFYVVAAATTGSTSAVLTEAYSGTGSSSATTTAGGTTLATNGSTGVTFSQAQTLSKGTILYISGQICALSANVASSTSGTLTAAFQGNTGSGQPTTAVAPLAGTFAATNGSAVVPTTASQVGAVAAGDSVEFVSQLGVYYTVLSLTASALTLTNPYSGVTAGTTNAVDIAQVSTAAAAIATQLEALSLIGTVGVTGAVITIQRTDGGLTDIQDWASNGFASIQLQDLTADPGIATDLAAIQAANGGAWYSVSLDSNSSAEVVAAARYIEATGKGGKVGFFNNSDWGNGVTSVTSDVFSQMQLLSLTRSFVQHNNSQLLCYAGAATAGNALGRNPGTYTLAYKELTDVPADTDTTLPEGRALAINSMTASLPGPGAKSGNYYKQVSGENWLWPGSTPAGGFMDNTIAVDWLVVNIQAAIATRLSALPKTPFTDIGLQSLGDALQGVLTLASGPQYQILVPNGQDPDRPIAVNVPKASSLTSTQRAKRDISGLSWSAGLQGAIQTATVGGVVTP
jgi:hypothetical protein